MTTSLQNRNNIRAIIYKSCTGINVVWKPIIRIANWWDNRKTI